MSFLLQGRKRGMTQIFDDDGNVHACTVIEMEKNVITQLKTSEKDGYNAVQLGFEAINAPNEKSLRKKLTKPLIGHFEARGVKPRRFLCESRVESLEGFELGQEFGSDYFEVNALVDVTSKSKGKGYQGVMKKHGFAGIGASHGAGPVHRHAGSTGNRSTPGRCFPGSKRASQMGDSTVTVERLRVMRIDADKGLLVVRGSVPGSKNSVVRVRKAVKQVK